MQDLSGAWPLMQDFSELDLLLYLRNSYLLFSIEDFLVAKGFSGDSSKLWSLSSALIDKAVLDNFLLIFLDSFFFGCDMPCFEPNCLLFLDSAD